MTRRLVPVLLAVLLAGCGLPDPAEPDPNIVLSSADVVGIWREASGDRTLTFAADGTFTATNVPYQLYVYGAQTPPAGFDPARDHVDASGTWRLTAPIGTAPERLVDVTLDAKGIATFPLGFSNVLDSWRQPDGGGSLVLDLSGGKADPYVYRKVSPAPSPS